MDYEHLDFSGHAVLRIFERKIGVRDVEAVLRSGDVVEDYATEKPLPSRLMLGFVDDKPIHVVVAYDAKSKTCHVVTVYPPNPALWEADFKSRKTK